MPEELNECEKLFLVLSQSSLLNGTRMKSSHTSAGLSGRELKRVLMSLCEHAYHDVSRLQKHEEVAVRQLRVRMKKLLALLRLARDGIEPHSMAAMAQHIRAVKNACSKSRDDRMRDKLIDKLVHRHHLRIKARQTLPTIRHGTPEHSFLRHQLHALDQLLDKTPIESICSAVILEQHARCYRKGRRLMKEAAENGHEGIWHRWRHRVKDLCYQTLVLARMPGARHRLRRSRRLSSLLGRDHDLTALAHEPAFCSRRSPWPDIIQDCREAIRQRCLALGHRLYATHSARFSGKLLCFR